jgi:hypothetical protein
MLKIKIMRYGYGKFAIKFSSPDSELFHAGVESLKSHLFEGERTYDADGRRWIVRECDNFSYWLEFIQQHYPAEIDNGQSYYQEQTRREEYKRPRKDDQLSKAFKELFLLPEAPLRVAKAVHKELVKVHHPDTGGDVEKMKRVNAAYDAIEKRLGGSTL